MAETTKNPETMRVAVVTGANKGIGFEISKQLASNGVKVILTARDVKRGTEAVETLKAAGYSDLSFHQLDVSDPVSISAFVNFIKTDFGKLDILVNNAAVNGLTTVGTVDPKDLKFGPDDVVGPNAGAFKKFVQQTYESAVNSFKTNYYGIKRLSKELIPLLQLSKSARIVNISSDLGQLKFISNENAKKKLGDVDGLTEEKVDEVVEEFLEDVKENLIEDKGWPSNNFSAYSVSKTVLNAYTRVLAKKYPAVAINAVSPGFTKTDLNYNAGVLTTEEAAKGPVMLALMRDSKPSGLFFDNTEVSTF
ncbi:(+)-neomenthol dehydrogenase-like [Castanea sativa]|uniref:(+)-neomenthol dehydrogenase-like n=1 Tax=Castanea sativa TaxID=21020 RepID=UPI003F64F6F1